MFQKGKTLTYPQFKNPAYQEGKTGGRGFASGWDMPFNFRKDFPIIIIGFLLARTNVLGQLLPFGMAIFLGTYLIQARRSLLVGGVVILGIFSLGEQGQAIEYGTVFTVFLLARKVLEKRFSGNYASYFIAALSFISVRLAFASTGGAVSYDYLLLCFELALSLAMAYVCRNVVQVLYRSLGRRTLSREEMICLLLVGALSLAGLDGLKIEGIGIKNIFSLTLIMLVAYLGGSGAGAVTGATIGLMSTIGNFIFPSVVGVYAFAGMLAGTLQELGKAAVGITFVIADLLISYFAVENSNFSSLLLETALALLLFILLPKGFTRYVSRLIPQTNSEVKAQINREKGFKEFLSNRLISFGDVFQEMSRTFDQLAVAKHEVEENEHVEKLLQTVAKKACGSCFRYQSCWGKEIYKISQGMLDLLAVAETKEELTVEDINGELARRCVRQKELVTTVNYLLENYKTNYIWEKKVFEGRQIVTNQLKGISEIMWDLSNEVKMDDDFQEEIADMVFDELQKTKCKIHGVNVFNLGKDRVEVEIAKQPCHGSGECVSTVVSKVSEILKQNLVVAHRECGCNSGKRQCHLQLLPLQRLGVETALAKAAKSGNMVSGDNSATFHLKDGHYVMALSDGMGVGPKAAMESNATVNLLENMLKNGFRRELALRTINSTLALRTQGESFATIDLAMIDLFTAEAEFIKVGASTSFIKRGKNVSVIQSRSLPAGVFNKPDAEYYRKKLKIGDLIVMVTDGALDAEWGEVNKEAWIISLLKEIDSDDPVVVADTVLQKAKARYGESIADDITVLVGKISRNF